MHRDEEPLCPTVIDIPVGPVPACPAVPIGADQVSDRVGTHAHLHHVRELRERPKSIKAPPRVETRVSSGLSQDIISRLTLSDT